MRTSNVERRRKRRLVLGAAVLLLAVLPACGGENLFSPGAGDTPEVVFLLVPESVAAGEDFDVRTRVTGEAALESVTIRARGATPAEESVTVPELVRDITVNRIFTVPQDGTGVVRIRVDAADVRGNESRPAMDSVTIVP